MNSEEANPSAYMLHACEMMRMMVADTRFQIDYSPRDREYLLRHRHLEGGPDLTQGINFCPWCGVQLPESLFERWLEEVDPLVPDGYDIAYPLEKLPERYQTDQWWRENPDLAT